MGEVNLSFFLPFSSRDVTLLLETQSLSSGPALMWFENLPFQFLCSFFIFPPKYLCVLWMFG